MRGAATRAHRQTSPAKYSPLAMTFQAQARSDHAELTRRFAQTGRLQAADGLTPAHAEALRRHLLERSDWSVIFNHGDRLYGHGAEGRAAISAARWSTLQAAVQNACRHILRVPQPHFVSMVTGLAPPDAHRLSVTG